MADGTCECGCGQPTRLAPYTHAGFGWVAGRPLRFINGHSTRRPTGYDVDENGCWIFQGHIRPDGYGFLTTNGRRIFAHRWYYERLVGPIPAGLTLDHVYARGCRSRACVNPAHLEPVTGVVNTMRGTGVGPVNAAKTHCPQGHPLAGDNLYVAPTGHRQCRTCRRAHDRKRRRRKAAS
jgi:hypothetical protein